MLLDTRLPLSYIFIKIKYEICYVLMISLVVYYLTGMYHDVIPPMPIAIPTFIGTAISVLLSFKLNQSYDRWWEARKVWGAIVNDSRSFVLQLQSFLPAERNGDIRTISLRHIAWCRSLGRVLTGKEATTGLEEFLSPDELEAISTHQNKPLAILQLNSRNLKMLSDKGNLDAFEHVQINNTMVNFAESMGMLERIKNTIFPVTYRIYLHGIIYLFVSLLSISLRDIKSYFEIPLLLVISSAFFLLEKAATDLQDPFSGLPTDIPVKTIANTIEINIKELIGETKLPGKIESKGFYID